MESWICGPHRLEFEGPDIFHCRVGGPVEEQHARDIVTMAEELCAKWRLRAFFVVHLGSGADTFTPGARKYLVSAEMADWQAIVVVGGSSIMRLSATVMMRAHSLIKALLVPTAMVKSMDEASAYIAKIRAKEVAHTAPPAASAAQ